MRSCRSLVVPLLPGDGAPVWSPDGRECCCWCDAHLHCEWAPYTAAPQWRYHHHNAALPSLSLPVSVSPCLNDVWYRCVNGSPVQTENVVYPKKMYGPEHSRVAGQNPHPGCDPPFSVLFFSLQSTEFSSARLHFPCPFFFASSILHFPCSLFVVSPSLNCKTDNIRVMFYPPSPLRVVVWCRRSHCGVFNSCGQWTRGRIEWKIS